MMAWTPPEPNRTPGVQWTEVLTVTGERRNVINPLPWDAPHEIAWAVYGCQICHDRYWRKDGHVCQVTYRLWRCANCRRQCSTLYPHTCPGAAS